MLHVSGVGDAQMLIVMTGDVEGGDLKIVIVIDLLLMCSLCMLLLVLMLWWRVGGEG